jgi:(2Fe-2S) ferredoxin
VDVAVEPYWCFNGCSHGPNVVLHDERFWYEGVGPDDIEPIARHAETGQPTGRACGGRIPPIVKENAYEALDRKYPVPGDDPPGAEREASLGSDAG